MVFEGIHPQSLVVKESDTILRKIIARIGNICYKLGMDDAAQKAAGDRYLTLTRILDAVQAHIDTQKPGLIRDIHLMAPGEMQKSARKEAWTLLFRGISHLRDGAPGNAPGSMTEALSKTSLRSSALAAGLGVPAPQFELVASLATHASGNDEALYLCKRLIEAAEGDISKSRQLVQERIFSDSLAGAFGAIPALEDTSLRGIFAALEPLGAKKPASETPLISSESLSSARKQVAMSFNALLESYAAACRTLHEELDRLPPPPAPRRSGSFDLRP